jgi:hypothetical protein
MNVIQFWLIDSIVKVDGIAGITLPSNSLDPADREPLFPSSADPASDDKNDSEGGNVVVSTAKRDVEVHGQEAQLLCRSNDSTHTYPPSLTGSPSGPCIVHRTSTSTSTSPLLITRSVLSVRCRHSPPAPPPPRSPREPACSSPDPALETDADVTARIKEDWQAWDGDEEQVDRVREEAR